MHIFGCTCYILNDRDHLGKFDPKDDDGIFLGYSSVSKAYRVVNKRRQTVVETINVNFDECQSISAPIAEIDEELDSWMKSHYSEPETSFRDHQDPHDQDDEGPSLYPSTSTSNVSSSGLNITPLNQIPPETSSSVNDQPSTSSEIPTPSGTLSEEPIPINPITERESS